MKPLQRCLWAQSDPLLQVYHDEEWGVPQHDSRALWEMLMLEGFQAGLSWQVILHKREAFRRAFKNFVPETVARFEEADVVRLLGDLGIVRARAKIEATISGARAYLSMTEAGEDFADFIWGFVDGRPLRAERQGMAQTPRSEELSKALKKRGFKFVGPVVVYAFMQAAGMVDDHSAACFRRTSVRRRNVECGVA